MTKPTKRIPLKTLLHMTHCRRCFDEDLPDMGFCDGCIVARNPMLVAEAVREFVAKEQEND